MASKRWQERLFGKRLINCSTIKDNNEYDLISTTDCLSNCEITIVFFSFANINAQSDDCTKHLVDLYKRLNGEESCGNEGKKLEVVQVVLWANNDVYGDFEQSHKDCIRDMPWYAMPFIEIELKTHFYEENSNTGFIQYRLKTIRRQLPQEEKKYKRRKLSVNKEEHTDSNTEEDPIVANEKTRLSRRYRIKVGVPTLVLVDSEGVTVTSSGKERLVEDPHGDAFPWRPRPVDQVLQDVTLIPGRLYNEEHPDGPKREIRYQDLPPDTIRGFYFSAHWCPPCRAFTPQIIETYKLVRKKQPGFEVIFVSSDRSSDSFSAYTATMPWLVIPWQHAAVRAELAQLYGVRGIPTLLLVDGNGHVVTHDARTELQDDPKAQNFPWKPRSVNILTERYATKLQDYPAIVLFVEGDDTDLQFADQILSPAATTYYKKHNINFNASEEDFLYACEDEHYIQFLVAVDSDTSELLRDLVGLDDVVPLLVGLDMPNNRYVVMDYGVEISVGTVQEFVDKFEKGDLEFKSLHEQVTESSE